MNSVGALLDAHSKQVPLNPLRARKAAVGQAANPIIRQQSVVQQAQAKQTRHFKGGLNPLALTWPTPCLPLATPLRPLASPLPPACLPLATPLPCPCIPLLLPCFSLAIPSHSPCLPLAFPLLPPCFSLAACLPLTTLYLWTNLFCND